MFPNLFFSNPSERWCKWSLSNSLLRWETVSTVDNEHVFCGTAYWPGTVKGQQAAADRRHCRETRKPCRSLLLQGLLFRTKCPGFNCLYNAFDLYYFSLMLFKLIWGSHYFFGFFWQKLQADINISENLLQSCSAVEFFNEFKFSLHPFCQVFPWTVYEDK